MQNLLGLQLEFLWKPKISSWSFPGWKQIPKNMVIITWTLIIYHMLTFLPRKTWTIQKGEGKKMSISSQLSIPSV